MPIRIDEFDSLDSLAIDRVIMDGDGSPLSSLCMVRAAELFPKPEQEKEDDNLKIPFTELAGEFVRYIGRTDEGVLCLSNYRICLKSQTTTPETEISIPLGVIETVTVRDLFQLVVSCKDASTFKCTFLTSEQCTEWQRRITLAAGVPSSLEVLFAFPYYAWASELQANHSDSEWFGHMQRATNYDDDFRREVKRLEFNTHTSWRISTANIDFKLCPTYPRLLLVPMCITDDILTEVAAFRSARRIPSVVWRHKPSGAVIGRCSQPEVGWLGWRNPKDEQLLKAIADACAFDGGEISRKQLATNNATNASETSSTDGSHEEVCMDEVKKILIVDARSYASAVTNRARGGGCECPEYYPCAAIEFMNLGNIHVIRKSFHGLRTLAATPQDSQNSWFSGLDRTAWLTHLAGMMQSAMRICHAIEREGRSVIVHCSDGWDRTPQLVSTALLCLDPYYRTVDGFRVLVEREWLSFGHKFADRIGFGPGSDETNERCPVFLQWLDCVHQIQKQFPCSFEFSMAYLIKLAQHVFSCMFGTFLCNSYKERVDNSVFDRTYSVWPFLSGPMYKNPLYIGNREQVLWPAYHPSNLSFWSEVYTSSFGNQNHSDSTMTTSSSATVPIANSTEVETTTVTPSTNDISSTSEPRSPMTKTRSYGDLQTAAGTNGYTTCGMTRRSSDPNMIADGHFNMNSSTNSSITALPENHMNGIVGKLNDINDEIATFSRGLNNLTEELQKTSLDDICQRSNVEPNRNQLNGYFTKATFDLENSIRTNGDLIKSEHCYANKNDTDDDGLNGDCNDEMCNGNCDVVDSSPNYTQYNDYLDNSSNSLMATNCYAYESANGRCTSLTADDDILKNPILQSVDLRESSPFASSPNGKSLWLGDIETSTDTLVPVIESSGQSADDRIRSELTTAINTVENGSYSDYTTSIASSKSRILPEVHNSCAKPKSHTNGISAVMPINALSDSCPTPSDHAKSEISYGINSGSNLINNHIANGNLSNRRNRDTFGGKISPIVNDLPNSNLYVRTVDRSSSPQTNIAKFSFGSNANTNRTINLDRTMTTTTIPSMMSCADGLAPALSEQNLRLLQIVHENKMREEALQRELQALRLALLKKRACSTCTNGQITNHCTTPGIVDETDDDNNEKYTVDLHNTGEHGAIETHNYSIHLRYGSETPPLRMVLTRAHSWATTNSPHSVVDNGVENISVGSWEAVEERSGPSSSASANNLSGVLWVPDHAVSKCTNCQTEFWLGRRKHHCRSCGKIFCADCSEYRAAVPEERFFSAVRLCGPCYHSITSKYQNNSHEQSVNWSQHSNGFSSSNPLEPCKNSIAPAKTTDPSSSKATTVTH